MNLIARVKDNMFLAIIKNSLANSEKNAVITQEQKGRL